MLVAASWPWFIVHRAVRQTARAARAKTQELSITLGYGSIPMKIPFFMGWTSIYQLFWGSLGTRVLTHPHLKLAYEIYECKIWVVCWTCEIPCACKATWINARQVCSSRWLSRPFFIQMLLWYYGQSISQFSIWHVHGASTSWEKVECCDASTQCVFEEDAASGTKLWPTQVAGSITWKHSALLSILTVGLRLNMAKHG